MKIGRRQVDISHPDKVLFTKAGLTKLDLAHHYERVAPVMLPYVAGRPLALEAHPGGIESKGFFMKAVPDYFPGFVARATMDKRGGTITHALAEDADTLMYLAGQTWLRSTSGSRAPTSRVGPTA